MSRPVESAEQIAQREYRIHAKDMSADRLVPYELYRLRLAIEAASENSGKWLATLDATLEHGLAAIALAASTPEDNSEQIKQFSARIHAQFKALEAAKQQSPVNEGE